VEDHYSAEELAKYSETAKVPVAEVEAVPVPAEK
jgi:hypothetical protein